jgi:hypothetical protein
MNKTIYLNSESLVKYTFLVTPKMHIKGNSRQRRRWLRRQERIKDFVRQDMIREINKSISEMIYGGKKK